VELLRSKRPVATVFDLLGTKEDDMTYSLGYVASRSPRFLGALLQRATGSPVARVTDAVVSLQTVEKGDRGRTDIEVRIASEVMVIFEAKRGPWLPSEAQLRRYAPILDRGAALTQRLVAVTNASVGHARSELPNAINGIPVRHISWRTIKDVAQGAKAHETRRNKHLLDEFTTYMDGIIGMQNALSNMVLVLSLGKGEAWGINFLDAVNCHGCYFDPVDRHRARLPNYLAFRYGGRLQSIHHVEGYETFTNPKQVLPEARDEVVQPHYLFKLGPAIKPAKEVKAGPKIVQANRVKCMLDTLLTCNTITEALAETQRRLRDGGHERGEADQESAGDG
jgi:hypothetical protein